MTGRKEPTAQQLQNYLKIIVDDLITLYDDGIMVKTPEYPDGTAVVLINYFLYLITDQGSGSALHLY
jgi:hypothetical protein